MSLLEEIVEARKEWILKNRRSPNKLILSPEVDAELVAFFAEEFDDYDLETLHGLKLYGVEVIVDERAFNLFSFE